MNKLPLFIVTGSSGSGKTHVIPELRKLLPEYDVFDVDIIWDGKQDWQVVKNNWFRVARSIAESGRCTVLCGTILPWEAEKYDQFESFSRVYFLNLHCDSDVRRERLIKRGWTEEQVVEYQTFAQWLLDNANSKFDPPMPTIDTSNTPPDEVASAIAGWIQSLVN
ncbi:AAA family ATPase [Ferroacidibacillus organovorans]|uniref:AAA family ATPase n=1 Tax=Ferroacidibacillus organovorans TaxID=1765683 RepID=UPI001FD5CF1D|nr:AAA family ATPase [Ferroacidibacillus organovorans]